VTGVNSYYLEHFLNETKTYLPSLTQLKVIYGVLKTVTESFTRDDMQRNCGRVKRLIVDYPENV
jgi:hypothetical protein